MEGGEKTVFAGLVPTIMGPNGLRFKIGIRLATKDAPEVSLLVFLGQGAVVAGIRCASQIVDDEASALRDEAASDDGGAVGQFNSALHCVGRYRSRSLPFLTGAGILTRRPGGSGFPATPRY